MNTQMFGSIQVDWEGDIPNEELAAYVERGFDKFGKNLKAVRCIPDGEYVEITYTMKSQKFQRLRRITGKPTK